MWFIYALTGAIITGIGQVFVKKGQVKLTPLLDNLLATFIVYTLLIPWLFVRGVNLEVSDNILVLSLIVAALYFTFFYIINLGKVSLMISLINTFPVVTIVLAIKFLNEWPNLYQWIGIGLVLVGVFFLSQEKKKVKIKNKNKFWVFWGLIGALTIGTAEFMTKLATATVDGFTFTFFVFLMYLPALLFTMIFDKSGRKFTKLKNIPSLIFTIIGILFIEAGLIAISLAYQHGFASIVSPVIATHLLITAILASKFLKEKLSNIQKLGILFNLVGLSVVGVWS